MREEIFNGGYLSVFLENGIIDAGHSDGVGYVGDSTEEELKALYEVLHEHFRVKKERMLVRSTMELDAMLVIPEPETSTHYVKSITKADRKKRSRRKKISDQSKKRNRRR